MIQLVAVLLEVKTTVYSKFMSTSYLAKQLKHPDQFILVDKNRYRSGF